MEDARLSDAQRSELERVLTAARDRTAARVAALERDFQRIADAVALDTPDDEHDPEGATTAFERAQVAALLDEARAQQVRLDEALEALQAGSYGSCARCGEPIPYERLLARPGTRTCVACAAADGPADSPR